MKKISRLSLTQKLLAAVAIPLLAVAVILGIVVNLQLNSAIPASFLPISLYHKLVFLDHFSIHSSILLYTSFLQV